MFLGKNIICSGFDFDFFMQIAENLNGVSIFDKKYVPDGYLDVIIYIKLLNEHDTVESLTKEILDFQKSEILIFSNGHDQILSGIPSQKNIKIIDNRNLSSSKDAKNITNMIYDLL